MKKIMRYSILIIITGCVGFTSCKKEKTISPVVTPPPAKARINFHIKNSFVIAGDSIYLYRIISTHTSNIYDSTQNIYLRPNIDTTFIYTVGGNTNNLFIVGNPDPDEIPYYMESRYVAGGSNINWDIIY